MKSKKDNFKQVSDKFNYINKLDYESCKYLCNIYTKLYNNRNDEDIQQYLLKNKCMYNGKLTDIARVCKSEGKFILAITNANDNRYIQLKAECEKQDVPIVLVDNKDKLSQHYINRMLNGNNNEMFLDVNIDSFNEWYNWDVIIEEKHAKTVERFQSISLEELKNSPEKHALACIIHNATYKHAYNKKGNFNIVSTIKRIDKLLEHGFNIGGNVWANIHSLEGNINKYYIYELSELINTLTYRNLTERYEYIYDLICKKLEYDIDKYGYCLFEDNKCIAQRDLQKWPENEYNGCCFDINKKEECTHLNCKQCDTKCISCRLFTCKYLKDRGIDYNIHKNIHARCFLNILQRPELVWNFFTNKEDILEHISKYANIVDKWKIM